MNAMEFARCRLIAREMKADERRRLQTLAKQAEAGDKNALRELTKIFGRRAFLQAPPLP